MLDMSRDEFANQSDQNLSCNIKLAIDLVRKETLAQCDRKIEAACLVCALLMITKGHRLFMIITVHLRRNNAFALYCV